jgi:hypothetical protein
MKTGFWDDYRIDGSTRSHFILRGTQSHNLGRRFRVSL